MAITYRKGTMADAFAVYQVFTRSIMDLGARTNVMAITGGSDPEILQSLWQRRKPLFDFLAETAAQFWVAEAESGIIGYARAIQHDGLWELTEFFVLPDQQSAGVGRELLGRVLPGPGTRYRVIIATLDERAMSRYLKAGVYARFPIKFFSRMAEKVEIETDLRIEPLRFDLHRKGLEQVDREIIGHARTAVHQWILTTRTGHIYKRGEQIVGYGYAGGPFALLNENDYPAVLAHAESLAAEKGEEFGVEVPLINKKALQYFLERRYQIDAFTVLFMSDEPFGRFENYLCISPIFFM